MTAETDYETPPGEVGSYTYFIAGAVAGVAEHTAIYPIDTIKTRMQALTTSPIGTYRGIFHAAQSIVAREGIFSSFKGISAVFVSAAPAHALYFYTYERSKEYLSSSKLKIPLDVVHSIAGIAANISSDIIMTPFDVVKQRMQLREHPTLISCIVNVFKKEGGSAFFRSIPTTIVMNIPTSAAHFITYERLRSLLMPKNKNHDHLTHIIAGAGAGAASAAITNPLDVIKTRIQTQDPDHIQIKYRGFFSTLSTIIREEGYRGFIKGMTPRMLFNMPSAAICWGTYEFMKFILMEQK